MTRLLAASRPWLWVVFVAVHVWLSWLALAGPGQALGDVHLYGWWVGNVLSGGVWVGVDTGWVYPVLALLPMLLAAVAGPDAYVVVWLVLVAVLDCVALFVLVGRRGRTRMLAVGWWWAAFLLAVGPIAVGRIDSITVPLAVIAVVLLARRPLVAGILLAVATWMKVWPGAIIAAAVVASRHRLPVLVGALVTTAVVLVGMLALGGARTVFSFLTFQTDRGIQIEAPVAAPWLWAGVLGEGGSGLRYDRDLLTYQVFGPGTDALSAAMTPLLVVAVAALLGLALWLLGRGARPDALVAPFAFALVTTLIVVNKVGSPQFVTWLAPAVILLLVSPRRRAWRVPAVLVLVIAGLTQVVYPALYGYLLILDPLMVGVLTLRNILLVVLAGWAVRAMVRTPRMRRVR